MFAKRRHSHLAVSAVLASIVMTGHAGATTFRIVPVTLDQGVTVDGFINTNGKTGALTGSDITGWSLTMTTVTRDVFTRANSRNTSWGLEATGSEILVPYDPECGTGGQLGFMKGQPAHPSSGITLADFTGSTGDPALSPGGAVYFNRLAGTYSVLTLDATAPAYAAATSNGGSNSFTVTPLSFDDGYQVSGTVTTNGATGTPGFVDWEITVTLTDVIHWDKSNSGLSPLVSGLSVSPDGGTLALTTDPENPGSFGVLRGSLRRGRDILNLADFTGVFDSVGYASYQAFTESLDYLTELPVAPDASIYVLARVPEPGTFSLSLFGLAGLGLAGRRRTARIPNAT